VWLWMRNSEHSATINAHRLNQLHLPDVTLPVGLAATTNLIEALSGVDTVLAATPAQTTRAVLGSIKPHMPKDASLVLCAKGIEQETGLFQSDIARDVMPNMRLAVLSGPGFAGEIARDLPTALTLAMTDPEEALALAEGLSGPRFRLYATDDLRGAELGGALKNVIAIAAGAAHGAGLGASASAALVTRGFTEMKRLAHAFGARPETLNGLSGLGDLLLTCNSAQSRNFAFGEALARGTSTSKLAEGAATAKIAVSLADKHKIEAPIIASVAALIARQTTIEKAVAALMARPIKAEDQ
jgi:glycerol-3-phosphate dehydrogenase (NAD(P)+)